MNSTNTNLAKQTRNNNSIRNDIILLAISVVVAIVLANTNLLVSILSSSREFGVLGSFFAGIFFTSIFTTAPAIVTFGEIAQHNSVLATAVFGAMGAVIGDYIIFRFIRDRLSEHLTELIQHQGFTKRVRAIFRIKTFRWLTFIIGGIILASPFPDEIAISIFGMIHMRTSLFIPISFIFNFTGIFIIGLVARALL